MVGLTPWLLVKHNSTAVQSEFDICTGVRFLKLVGSTCITINVPYRKIIRVSKLQKCTIVGATF